MKIGRITMLIFCTLWVTAGCNRAKQQEQASIPASQMTEIEGLLLDGAGCGVVLEEMAPREFIPVDTAICDERGEFNIRFEQDKLAFYVLRTGPAGYITLLLEPGEKVRFSGSSGQTELCSLKGSPGSELLLELAHEHKKALNELGDIARKNVAYQSSPDYVLNKKELDLRFDSVTDAFQNYSLEFIHSNKESLAILIALYNLYGNGLPVFHPDDDLAIYKYVDSVLTIRFKGFEAVDLLHAQILEAETARSRPAQNPGPVRGEIAPDFVSSTPDGGQLALSELRGNYVLLSFWAGWSKLSREENMTLLKAWEKFNHMPFRILQVSLDGEREVWLNAVEQDKLSWDHVSELRRWESIVAGLYQVDKIPSNYLIDPTGRIVGVNLFGKELIERLEQLFSME
ncbi:MAG: TlpA disulfide reductase family protein [Bacteroidota bacterium]